MAISLRDVSKSFGSPPTRVLHDIHLDIQDGEFISLLGRSGSGKSTLLYILSTLDSPTAGQVLFDGKDVARMGVRELHQFRNRQVGFVFQFHHLLPELTALENVLIPAMKGRGTGVLKDWRAKAAELLQEFDLGNKLDRLPRQLSGGEQQRVAIARSLIMSPKYLFADEPTGNLDSANGDVVMNLLSKINRERGTTVIYVTHDAGFATMAKRSIRLKDGRVVS
jgi:putative ABC transport system ATP-binding protein/lipoprotein-releasing system ATP-binding protein